MLPPMFVSEPDTTAPSPWIAPARPHLQFSRSSTLPLCHSARYCYGTQARPHFWESKLEPTLGREAGGSLGRNRSPGRTANGRVQCCESAAG